MSAQLGGPLSETADNYHQSDAIGSGDIRAFLKSPRLFRDRMDGLCERDTPAMLFGTAAHLALLEPLRFHQEVVVRPDEVDFRTKDGRAWRDSQHGKIIVKSDDAVRLGRMHQRMPAEVHDILSFGESEATFRYAIGNGAVAQCRCDKWYAETRTITDVKTIADMATMERAIWRYSYHIQAQWYRFVVERVTGVGHTFMLVFAETNPPHRWRIVELDAEYRMLADSKIEIALAGIARRMKSRDWSDPADLREMVSPPNWMRDDDEEGGDE
jgi:hypothetical protein